MIALLGLLLVVTVSGYKQVEGILGGSVLLPCSCSGRDITQPMEWQMVEQFPVFTNVNNVSEFNKTYVDRASVFLESNCSLLLKSLKKEDQGKYNCICQIDDRYMDFYVNLTVVAHFQVCQKVISPEGKNEKVFQCNVSGHDKEPKIQWYSDGQPLPTEITIPPTYTPDTETGLSNFSSILRTHLNVLNPKCDVKSEGIQTKITENCNGEFGRRDPPIPERNRYIIIIPFVTVGLCVVLWCWWKFS